MVGKSNSAIIARRQARERLARERAEQAARDRDNEADLVDFLMLEQRIAAADADLDAAVEAARDRHRVAITELKQRQALCLARMSRRGEPATAIADRTGLTAREIRHLIGSAADAETDAPSSGTPAGRGPSSKRRPPLRGRD